MRSMRSIRLTQAALFSFGTMCGFLCFRGVPADGRGILFSRLLFLHRMDPVIFIFAAVLIWPLMMTFLGCSVFGEIFVVILIIACGFSVGTDVYTHLYVPQSLSVFLLALIPFSCCIVSYSADQRSIALELRQRIRSGSREHFVNRYTLMRMMISVLIIFIEAICLIQIGFSVC